MVNIQISKVLSYQALPKLILHPSKYQPLKTRATIDGEPATFGSMNTETYLDQKTSLATASLIRWMTTSNKKKRYTTKSKVLQQFHSTGIYHDENLHDVLFQTSISTAGWNLQHPIGGSWFAEPTCCVFPHARHVSSFDSPLQKFKVWPSDTKNRLLGPSGLRISRTSEEARQVEW